jgi:phosphoribosylformylglycinamidine synthase
VAVGADPNRLALLDNFCWGDPNQPETLGGLVAAALACRDAAIAYKAPFISGKDSFNNEYLGNDGQRHAIPPTLLISALGIMPDWRNAVTMDVKEPGNWIYLVGPFQPTLGGSHLSLVIGMGNQDGVPNCRPGQALVHYRALYAAIRAGLVCACHDLSEGGLAVAAAEMCIGGRLGMQLDLPEAEPWRACFGETTGCLLVEVPEAGQSAFHRCFNGLNHVQLGRVSSGSQFNLVMGGKMLIQQPVEELVRAWKPQAV